MPKAQKAVDQSLWDSTSHDRSRKQKERSLLSLCLGRNVQTRRWHSESSLIRQKWSNKPAHYCPLISIMCLFYLSLSIACNLPFPLFPKKIDSRRIRQHRQFQLCSYLHPQHQEQSLEVQMQMAWARNLHTQSTEAGSSLLWRHPTLRNNQAKKQGMHNLKFFQHSKMQ